MAFVFNANAAAEINQRLSEMLVEGHAVIPEGTRIAQTFHAFARRIVYEVAAGRESCGDILAGEAFVLEVVRRMLLEEKWEGKIRRFLGAEETESGETADEGKNAPEGLEMGNNGKLAEKKLTKSAKNDAEMADDREEAARNGRNYQICWDDGAIYQQGATEVSRGERNTIRGGDEISG